MMDWQPIATAPKDGTRILATVSNAHEPGVDIVFWSGDRWLVGDPDSWWDRKDHGITEWHDSLTHWMPLPEPPASLKGEKS